jgi:phospholipid N-methyltransferase
VTPEQARALIAPVVRGGESWVDVGAGTGTFTRALAELLGHDGTVYAVEREAGALGALRFLEQQRPEWNIARITVIDGDFTTVILPRVNGVLAANALHFVPVAAQAAVLSRLRESLDENGRVVVIEYDRERGNPWVPYPISRKRLTRLAREAGFHSCEIVASTPSEFGGEMYVAALATTASDSLPITSPDADEPG